MKNRRMTMAILVLFLWIAACHYDSLVYPQVHVENAFWVENTENLHVGDTLYINLKVDRYLKEDGYSNLLDLFETTGARRLSYYLSMERYSTFSGQYERQHIYEIYLFAEKGEIDGGTNYAVLHASENYYESRIGMVLPEKGSFRIDLNNLGIYPEISDGKVYVEITNIPTDTALLDFEVVE